MEQLKPLDKITEIDHRHVLWSQVEGGILSLEKLHAFVSKIELEDYVPEDVRGQFNVARNMALYSYFCYTLNSEVPMKTFAVMELALRQRYNGNRKKTLSVLVNQAFNDGLFEDKGFRHVPDDAENPYSKNFIKIFPKIRNIWMHGTTNLIPDGVGYLEKCADFVNQIYASKASGA